MGSRGQQLVVVRHEAYTERKRLTVCASCGGNITRGVKPTARWCVLWYKMRYKSPRRIVSTTWHVLYVLLIGTGTLLATALPNAGTYELVSYDRIWYRYKHNRYQQNNCHLRSPVWSVTGRLWRVRSSQRYKARGVLQPAPCSHAVESSSSSSSVRIPCIQEFVRLCARTGNGQHLRCFVISTVIQDLPSERVRNV